MLSVNYFLSYVTLLQNLLGRVDNNELSRQCRWGRFDCRLLHRLVGLDI